MPKGMSILLNKQLVVLSMDYCVIMVLISYREYKIAEHYTENRSFNVKLMTPANESRLLVEAFEKW